MYSARLRTLTRAYKSAERNNMLYDEAVQKQHYLESQVNFLVGLSEHLKTLDQAITTQESEWRQAVLSILASGIADDLAFVYPADGYQVNLSARVLRGKIHIDATVTSTFAKDFPGRIRGTQGRLFQQVQTAHQSTFPRAGKPDNSKDISFFDGKTHIIHSRHFPRAALEYFL